MDASRKMTRAEAGMLGMIERVRRVKARYEANPNLCPTCQRPIPYDKRHTNKFCSHSCAATFSNLHRVRTKKPLVICAGCGKKTKNPKFCSNKCQREFDYQKTVSDWLAGKLDGLRSAYMTTDWVKRWIGERDGKKCSICQGTEWLGKPMPLILDHIDGNGLNSVPQNLRFVCPNCDRFLPTFGSRNRGKGRKARHKYDAWRKGLSSFDGEARVS